MMNATHGPSAAAGGVGTLRLTPFMDQPLLAGLWIGVWAAGGLLPDTDHHSSSPARMWGPLTQAPCWLIGRISGGHRKATHDVSKGAPLVFALAAAAGWLAGIWWHPARLLTVAVVLGLAFLACAMWLPGKWEDRPLANLAAAGGGAVALDRLELVDGRTALLLAVALAGGVLVGIGGDACTVSGVPWRGRDVHLVPSWLRLSTGSPSGLVIERCIQAVLWVGVPALAVWMYGVSIEDLPDLDGVRMWLESPSIPAAWLSLGSPSPGVVPPVVAGVLGWRP